MSGATAAAEAFCAGYGMPPPMALAIMGGLAVATALTLVFLPALYVVWFRIPEDDPQD